MIRRALSSRVILAFVISLLLCSQLAAQTPVAGENVNMVSGTKWPWGDPFLERQNEPQIAVSTRNGLHLMAGANDYRTVDLNIVDQLPAQLLTGDAWLGLFESLDGGRRWQSTLIPGYPQDTSALGMASPLHGLSTGSDPVVRAGTNGMFYYGGIAFNRGTNNGVVFVSRFQDLSDTEQINIMGDQSPIRYISTGVVASGSAGQFLDKPQLAVDIPRAGAGTCTMQVKRSDGSSVNQSFAAGTVYMAWAEFVGSTNLIRSKVRFSRSLDCGATWSNPTMISQTYAVNNGPSIAIDPETGHVYVAWRTAAAASNPDAIVVATSTDGGNSFSKGVQVVGVQPYNSTTPNAPSLFDEQTTGTEFRSLSFPTLAADDSGIAGVPGRVYLAWSQRGAMPCLGQPAMAFPSDSKIVLSTSPDGANWSLPCAVDTGMITDADIGGPITDGGGATFSRGNQFMPAMTFIEGQLMLTYYDQRLDHTSGNFTPSVDMTGFFTPDSKGNFFEEDRAEESEPDSSGVPIFTNFVDDAGLQDRRHTLDVNLAQSTGGASPSFTFTRVSRYDFGLFSGEDNTVFHQLKFNPPNLPMFAKGTAPFIGDYIDIAGQMFVPIASCSNQSQCWTYNNPNNAALKGVIAPSPVHYATWTSNQDVIPPANGDWTTFLPITSGISVTDNKTPTPACQPNTGFEGDRNQNIYNSRITQGLQVSSPQASKPLSATVERGFVVLLQNFTNGRSPKFVNFFRLTIANQPANGFASFQQLVPPSPVPSPPFPNMVSGMPFPFTSADVAVSPHSGIARTVFAVSSNPTASITVNVQEIDGLNGNPLPGGLSSFIVLNADGTVPNSLVDPNGQTGSTGINGVELYSPNITGPNITGPNITGPNITGPNITGPNITGSGCSAPNITGPNITGSGCTSDTVANPNITGSNVSAPNITGSSVADATYTVTGNGNTHSGQHAKLVGSSPVPLQLSVTQIYQTPATDGQCNLVTAQQDINLSNVPNATFTPPSQLGNPNITGTDVTDASFDIGPNDTVFITLRGQNVTVDQMKTIVAGITPVVVPEAINSNDTTSTTPPFIAPGLVITTASIPNGAVGNTYDFTLNATGGIAPYTWTVSAGSLPIGLSLSSAGVITGTTQCTALLCGGTTPVTFPSTITVTDSAAHSAFAQYSITIDQPNVTFLSQPTGPNGPGFVTVDSPISPSVVVQVLDPTGAALAGVTVTMAIANPGINPGGGSLSGTLSAITDPKGVASFPNLVINALGSNYQLSATATSGSTTFTSLSNPFDVISQIQ